MRILILGTSNSILYPGWSFGLRQALPNATIENMSIGASPGIQFNTKLETTIFSEYDFVFFDSIPNDQTYHDEHLTNYDKKNTILFHKITFEIIKRIASQTKLIVLCIDEQRYYNCNSEFYNNRISFAQNANAYFVNTTLLINEYAKKNGINQDIIYDYHPSHPDRGIMHVIGQAIGELLPSLIHDPIVTLTETRPNPFINWWPTSKYETKQYKNSLVDDIYAILYENQSIKFNKSFAENTLIGFYINISKTNCVMDLLFNNKIVFSISLSYPNAEQIVKVFIPIPEALQVTEIRIRPATDDNVNYYALAARKGNFANEKTILTLSLFSFCNLDLLDPSPFLLQASPSTNLFQSNKLQLLLEQSFKTEQHYKKIFLIKPHTGNDIIDKSNFFNQNVTSPNKRMAIFTYHERILCYNIKDKTFQPLLLEDIDKPDIYLVNILSLGQGNVTFFINVLNNIFYISPFNGEDNYFFYECHYDRILFKKDNQILSSSDSKTITTISTDWGSYELFPLGCIVN